MLSVLFRYADSDYPLVSSNTSYCRSHSGSTLDSRQVHVYSMVSGYALVPVSLNTCGRRDNTKYTDRKIEVYLSPLND